MEISIVIQLLSILINASLSLLRIQPSEEWIDLQIPEVIKNGVKGLGKEMYDIYEMDAEAFVQAYVNIVVGACISLGNQSPVEYEIIRYFISRFFILNLSLITFYLFSPLRKMSIM